MKLRTYEFWNFLNNFLVSNLASENYTVWNRNKELLNSFWTLLYLVLIYTSFLCPLFRSPLFWLFSVLRIYNDDPWNRETSYGFRLSGNFRRCLIWNTVCDSLLIPTWLSELLHTPGILALTFGHDFVDWEFCHHKGKFCAKLLK